MRPGQGAVQIVGGSGRDVHGEHLGALHADELQIEDEHVGLVLLDEPRDFRSVGRRGDDADPGLPVEQGPEALEHDGVIVGQEDANHGGRAHRAGSVTVRDVPRPGALSSAKAPPSMATRS